jgi:hypothetical protein
VRTNIVPIFKCVTGNMDYLDEFEDEYEYASIPAPHRPAHAAQLHVYIYRHFGGEGWRQWAGAGGAYRLGLRGAGGHHLAGWRAVVMLIVAALLVGWRWPQPDGLGGA